MKTYIEERAIEIANYMIDVKLLMSTSRNAIFAAVWQRKKNMRISMQQAEIGQS